MPARGGSVAADVAAVLAEHHPVWSWQLSRLLCAADGREACPCHRNAADLYDHESGP